MKKVFQPVPGRFDLFLHIESRARSMVIMFFLWLNILLQGLAHAQGVPYDPDAIHDAVTEDGITIKIYHYRPAKSEPFRTNGSPVLLFPGILQNSSQYLSCSPEEVKEDYANTELPEVLPDWALAKRTKGNAVETACEPVLEKYIREDPMKIWSLAHYLWIKGYDPWFANYRGTGRGSMRSGGEKTLMTLDTWGTLDAPAAIEKVRDLTGKDLYIGGHSTGSFVSYIYLQGCIMDHFGWCNKALAYKMAAKLGFQPHVRGSSDLAAQRNSFIRGWIAIDPAGSPPLPSSLDKPGLWKLVGSDVYLSADDLAETLLGKVPVDIFTRVNEGMFSFINEKAIDNPEKEDPENIFSYLNFWNTENMDTFMGDLTARYALSGASIRLLGQYMDCGLNSTIREFWKNGFKNKDKVRGPAPDPGHDGYYYYTEHMDRITVPMMACLSESPSLVDADAVYRDIIARKTAHDLDEWFVLEGTAHFDLAAGKKSPCEVFPRIGDWLDRVEASYK